MEEWSSPKAHVLLVTGGSVPPPSQRILHYCRIDDTFFFSSVLQARDSYIKLVFPIVSTLQSFCKNLVEFQENYSFRFS